MSSITSLRMLQAHELVAVSGGDIVVNGTRPSEPIDPRLLDALRFNFNMVTIEELGLGISGLATPNPDTGDVLNPDEDSDGDGIPNWEDDPIVVNGDPSVFDGYVLAPTNLDGRTIYMYPIGPDGRADLSRPVVLTPEGRQFTCDAYREWQEANGLASFQIGAAGIPIGVVNPVAGTVVGVISTAMAAQGYATNPPPHCVD